MDVLVLHVRQDTASASVIMDHVRQILSVLDASLFEMSLFEIGDAYKQTPPHRIALMLASRQALSKPASTIFERHALEAWSENSLILVKLDDAELPLGLRDLTIIDASDTLSSHAAAEAIVSEIFTALRHDDLPTISLHQLTQASIDQAVQASGDPVACSASPSEIHISPTVFDADEIRENELAAALDRANEQSIKRAQDLLSRHRPRVNIEYSLESQQPPRNLPAPPGTTKQNKQKWWLTVFCIGLLGFVTSVETAWYQRAPLTDAVAPEEGWLPQGYITASTAAALAILCLWMTRHRIAAALKHARDAFRRQTSTQAEPREEITPRDPPPIFNPDRRAVLNQNETQATDHRVDFPTAIRSAEQENHLGTEGHVFISYARADRIRVEPIVDTISRDGKRSIWIDKNNITSGPGFAGAIVRAIRSAETVVVMCSQAAFQSDHVKREVYLADRYQRPLSPVFLEEAKAPDDLEYFFAHLEPLRVFELSKERIAQELDRTLSTR